MSTKETAGPELTRLRDRLFNNPERRLLHMNVWWGPRAASLSVEERAGLMNRAMDGREGGRHTPVEDIDAGGPPQVDVLEWLRERGL